MKKLIVILLAVGALSWGLTALTGKTIDTGKENLTSIRQAQEQMLGL